MNDLYSEKEQLESLRAWWSDYGWYVITGLVAGAAILFGLNYWQGSRIEAQREASALYDTLSGHVADGELDEAAEVEARISGNYAGTPYAAQAKLAMARLYMDKNRDQDAARVLRELLALGGHGEVKPIARLRLARILLYQDDPEAVVELLEGRDEGAFAARYAETLGDAYAALGRVEDARAAFRRALSETTAAPTVDQSLVQLKLNDLPASGASPDFGPAGSPMPAATEVPAQAEPAAGQPAADEAPGAAE